MAELAGEIYLPELLPIQVDTSVVMPLVHYLDSLENASCDRQLSWAEDEQAIGILRGLVPSEDQAAQMCVTSFTHQRYRKSRTLAQWYMMCKHIVEHIHGGVCTNY